MMPIPDLGFAAAVPGGPPPPGPAWTRIDLYLKRQRASRWCWAAVAQAVLLHRCAVRVDQCRIASHVSGRWCCPRAVGQAHCNRRRKLSEVLDRLHLWAADAPGCPSAVWLRFQLGRGRPVPIAVRSVGGRHFLLVAGVRADGRGQADHYLIHDPRWRDGHPGVAVRPRALADPTRAYGRWTHTYQVV